MNTPQFQLEPYKGNNTRYRCPSCGKVNQFTRYIDVETREYLDPSVGICNRIDHCGYHYSPKQYFTDNPIHKEKTTSNTKGHKSRYLGKGTGVKNKVATISEGLTNTNSPSSFTTIPHSLFAKSLNHYDNNNFALGLERLLGTKNTIDVLKRYHIGTSKHPQNGTIFWQVDKEGTARTGKIMLYDINTLKRYKNKGLVKRHSGATGQKQGIDRGQHDVFIPVVDWVHSRLQKRGGVKAFSLQQCLFGLYQLNTASKDAVIGIVESEKTAVIASMYMPTMVWMATGGAQHLNFSLLQPLMGRRVVLFPDVNQYELWQRKVENIQQQAQQFYHKRMDITVSDFIERKATFEMKAKGADLADILIKRDAFTGLALTDFSYPMMWDI